MALLETLTKPWVIEPMTKHTHTVIFLHKFPSDIDKNTLRDRLLCEKSARDELTLRSKFPSIRWVFPHAKQHPVLANGLPDKDHWGRIKAEERAALSLVWGDYIPYITQVIMNEAQQLAGGTEKIILGGRGTGSVAACRALQSFPELPTLTLEHSPDLQARFVKDFFGNESWTEIRQVKLAGFVGMHGNGGMKPRSDETDFQLLSNLSQKKTTVAGSLLQNTPHTIVRTGYNHVTMKWGPDRLHVLVEFVAELGVRYEPLGYGDEEDEERARAQERVKSEPEADEKIVAGMDIDMKGA
ncbi:hypothetical protein HD806DRAFT_401603 [Xylariaceae sp. AK1471]|nr:hypothetical protein HD806DRAFT_401603 [Xylariaceae sp. AK1471]